MRLAIYRARITMLLLACTVQVGCTSGEKSLENDDRQAAGNANRSESRADSGTGLSPPVASGGPDTSVIVSGPITGGMGRPLTFSVVDLPAHGYSEREFFYEGDATAYELQGQMSMDGKWTLATTKTQHFKSRMLVRRPLDAGNFNGTVVIEWLNVSGGADADPGFIYNADEITREGYAWIGVSAQAQGVVGGAFAFPIAGLVPLVQSDPARYGSLKHPGDAYSFDMFTRVAQIVRGAGELDVLEGLEPKRLIAYGESQSAGRMVSYVNGVHPLVKAFDGFFIHSRGAGGVPFTNETTLGPPLGSSAALIRDDIAEPVFQFETETDVIGGLGFLSARQPDNSKLRTWEVAGTSHIDAYSLSLDTMGAADQLGCKDPNNGPQHYVIRAALHALNQWISTGTAPVGGDPLMADVSGKPITDSYGNTLGGVRTPDVDVPIATLSGLPAADSSGFGNFVCALFGHTIPFTVEQLVKLYPTHDDYFTRVKDSARASREAQFILPPEEQEIVAKADTAPIPK